MNIARLKVSELQPAPYNPRQALRPGDPAYDRLARSLHEFDLVQPFVWNRRTGHLVSGHQRLEILKARGVTEVECVVVDLALEREQALNVTLNNGEVASDWEPAKLVALLEELHELPDFDATLTGFDADRLNDLLLAPSADWHPVPPDEDDTEPALVTVTLEIPAERWPDVRAQLDGLLAREPDVRLHVRSD